MLFPPAWWTASMPHPGRWGVHLVNKLAYKTGEPVRGDIVVFVFPINPQEDLIKRVIGLPGESVSVHYGVVSVNGTALTEPYIASPPAYDGDWIVPDGQLFVLGDNRNDSRDSHQWGLLPIENVIGRAVLIYWPPEQWQVINQNEQTVAGQEALSTR
jgi:signal peptidase I